MSHDASVIIVNWNGRQHLEGCLDALEAQRGVDFETILVDNGSTDGSVTLVKQRYPDVRLVTLDSNHGFAGGNNRGAAVARGRHLVFLNNDTRATPGWLAALCSGVDETRGVVLTTSCLVYMDNPGTVDSAGDGAFRNGGAFKHFHGQPVATARQPREVFAVCGGACLIQREVFEALGGFDEDFFVSHEDVDLSYRARLRGYRCHYVPSAVVRHQGSATLGRASRVAVYHGQRNLEWVYFKNTPTALLWRTLPGHVLYDLAAAAYFLRHGLFLTFLRAKLAALGGLPRVFRQRAIVQGLRTVDAFALERHFERHWLATKRREKRFDAASH